jgi:hypothetical protein
VDNVIKWMIYYGGVPYYLVRNAIYCKKCKDTISSSCGYKKCTCGAAAIDEGRILGDLAQMETRCMYCAYVDGKTIWLPQHVSEEVWVAAASTALRSATTA